MHRPLRGLLIALLLGAVVIAVVPSGASARRAAPEGSPFSFGVEFERPTVGLEKALRRRKIVVHYSCMRACRPLMRLKVAGNEIAAYDPPGGPTAGSRAAVFKLGPAARRTIVEHTHRGVAAFHLRATFTSMASDRLTMALRFRLRR
jgi:hypothetical protein